METGTVRLIQEAITRIENTVEEGGNPYPSYAGAKMRCLQHMLLRAKESQKWIKPEVFVSYTGTKGYEIMVAVTRSINTTKAPGTNTTFHCTGGMDQRGDSQPEVLGHIIEKLRPCSLFVGILTREWEIAAKKGSGGFGPGGWG